MIGLRAFSRIRYAAPSNVGGLPSYAAPTTTTIRGSIQPVTGHDLEQLAEGDRSRAVLKVYSLSEMRTATPGGAPADRVVWAGHTWLVYQVQDWPRVGSVPRHWRTILVALAEDETYVPPPPPPPPEEP
jgi:hypothetical protein